MPTSTVQTKRIGSDRYVGIEVPLWVYWMGIVLAGLGILALAATDFNHQTPRSALGPLGVTAGILIVGFGVDSGRIAVVLIGAVLGVLTVLLTISQPAAGGTVNDSIDE